MSHLLYSSQLEDCWEDAKAVIQADLRGSVGCVPDHRNKSSITIKRVTIFSLMEGLAFHV